MDFTDRLQRGQKKKKGIKNNTKVVGFKMERMTLPLTEKEDVNGRAVLGEEEKRKSLPSGPGYFAMSIKHPVKVPCGHLDT